MNGSPAQWNGVVNYLASSVAGDFDSDGDVDQNDFTVWRQNYGATISLGADGNHNGQVDAADYTVWRDQLPAGAGLSSVATAIPEASSISLGLIALCGGLGLLRISAGMRKSILV